MRTYSDIFNEYIGSGRNVRRSGFIFSVWLFFKGKEYRGRRNRILHRQCKIRAGIRLRAAMNSSNCLFDKIARDDIWQGTLMPIPFQQGANNERKRRMVL